MNRINRTNQKTCLNTTKRSQLLKRLSEKQREALYTAISTTHKSEFANILAGYKGTEKWDFLRYVDHGERSSYVRCECGRQLRYEFVLIHKDTKQVRSLGINHLQEELEIPDEIAKEVYKKIHKINYDLDEILIKVKEGWVLDKSIIKYINEIDAKVPSYIKILLDAKLPILDRFIDSIFNKTRNLPINNAKLAVQKFDKTNLVNPLPEGLSSICSYIRESVIPVVNSNKRARYLITKQVLPYKIFEEINIPKKSFYDDYDNQLRYGLKYFQPIWKYHSPESFNYRGFQYGPKMCIAKIDILPQGHIGLLVLFGYKSIQQLQGDVRQFIKTNKLPSFEPPVFLY